MAKCYLCGKNNIVCLKHGLRDVPGIDVLKCQFCGLVFLSSFDHIDDSFYRDSRIHTEETMNPNDWANITEPDAERRFQLLKNILSNKMVLDFGCGTGNFLRKAKEISTIIGVEPERRFGYYENLSQIPSKVKFDVITLFHVIEHLKDPRDVLSKLKSRLAENGQIFIETPNANDALLTIYKSKAFAEFTYWSCHLFLFTSQTLSILAEQAELNVGYIQQIQRFPVSNHLHWFSTGKPNGHNIWEELNSEQLNRAYENQLASIGRCDTLFGNFIRKENKDEHFHNSGIGNQS